MYTDRPSINIVALVPALNSVNVDNKTRCLNFIVYINSHWFGSVHGKITT